MAHRTIMTKLHEGFEIEEGVLTAVSVLPGQLLERTSAGTFQKHSTNGGPAEMLVAVEDDLQGKDVDDAYAASSRVRFVVLRKGDVAAMRIPDVDSAAGIISIGEFLESDGSGNLKAYAQPSVAVDSSLDLNNQYFPLAVALEAIDMSSSSGVHGNGLIAARVL